MKKARVVTLVRISTNQQTLKRQKEELKDLCSRNEWDIVLDLEEVGSGSRLNSNRSTIQTILQLAKGQQIDKVVVQELSRLGRRTGESISLIEQLSDLGVSVYEKARNIETLNDDGSKNAIGALIMSVLASIHSMESSERNARISSGIQSRLRAGLPWGRPRNVQETSAKFLKKHSKLVKSFENKENLSLRKRADLYKVSVNTVRKVELALYERDIS